MIDIEPNFEIQKTPESPKAKFQIPPRPKRILETNRLGKMVEAWKEISTRERAILVAKSTILFEELKERRSRRNPPV